MKYHKRFLAMLTAALIACTPIAASAVTFADMNNVPWAGAETSINKAADLGLMVGSQENGKTYFRPRDSVSLCEMAQLSYKLMTNTGKISSSTSAITDKWTSTMQMNQIPTWAHTALAVCLEMNIVSVTDLSSFMNGNVAAAANREQAAAMLGRTLAVSVPSLSGTATTTFKDDYQISSTAKPYVALLVKQGVVKGDNVGNFNPKNTLNRTETAVMVTNLYSVLANSNTAALPSTSRTVNGTISSADYRSVSIKGDSNYYYFGASTVLERGKSNSSITELVTAVQKNKNITATMSVSADNYIQKIVYTTPEDNDTIVKGTIKSLSNSEIKVDSKTYPLSSSSDLTVKIDGSSKTLSKLKDEVKSSSTTVTATVTVDGLGYVTKIDAKTKDVTKEATGKVNYLTTSKIEIGSTTYYIDDSDDITIKIDGSTKSFSKLKDAYNDSDITLKATVTYDSDKYVQKIVATTTDNSSHVYNGNITSFSTSSLKMNGTKYNIESGAYVSVDIYEDGYYVDTVSTVKKLADYASNMSGFDAMIEVRGGNVMSIEGNLDIEGGKTITGTVTKLTKSSLKINGTSYDIMSNAYVYVDIYEGGYYSDYVTSVSSLASYAENMIGFDAMVEIRGGKVMSIEGNMDIEDEDTEEYVEGSVSSLTSSSIKINGTKYNINSGSKIYVYVWNDFTGDYEEVSRLNVLTQMYDNSYSFYAEAYIVGGTVESLLGEMDIYMEVYG